MFHKKDSFVTSCIAFLLDLACSSFLGGKYSFLMRSHHADSYLATISAK